MQDSRAAGTIAATREHPSGHSVKAADSQQVCLDGDGRLDGAHVGGALKEAHVELRFDGRDEEEDRSGGGVGGGNKVGRRAHERGEATGEEGAKQFQSTGAMRAPTPPPDTRVRPPPPAGTRPAGRVRSLVKNAKLRGAHLFLIFDRSRVAGGS